MKELEDLIESFLPQTLVKVREKGEIDIFMDLKMNELEELIATCKENKLSFTLEGSSIGCLKCRIVKE